VPQTQQIALNPESLSSALKKAIAVERRAQYADFQGRRSTFSSFMRQTAARLCRTYPKDALWVTIRALFREYPNTDVGTRISIVKRAEELLANAFPEVSVSIAPTSEPQAAAENTRSSQTNNSLASNTQASNKPASNALAGNALVGDAPARNAPVASRTTPPSARPTANPIGNVPKPAPVFEKPPIEKNSKDVNPSETDVQFVKGVGPKLAGILKQININTVEDLLRHYPRRHLDFQNKLNICDLQIGQEVTILGTIRSVGAFQSKRGNMSIMTIVIYDGTGSITVTKFIGGRSNKYLLDRYKAQYPKGAQVLASGIVEHDSYGRRYALKNAEIEILGFSQNADGEEETEVRNQESIHVGRLVPVYPLTEGLSLRHLRNVMYNALQSYGTYIRDALPDSIRQQYGLTDLQSALANIHFPETPESIDEARRRLVFDELFMVQLRLAVRRLKFDRTENALSFEPKADGYVNQLRKHLPFTLTGAQERVFGEIARDLAAPKPMHRLVQGDVGSGKTVVALMAALTAIDNGFQAVVMAPTEILAEQHYRQFQKLITPLGLRCAVVLGKQGAKERKQIHQELFSGQVHIAVGTHALLEEAVEFKNLGLIIIDEQHRFGVKQRARLKAKSLSPELLTMTATPIPRTLALTIHGDLDVSEIDEMPPGRKPIKTELKTGSLGRKEVWNRVQEQILFGRQVYVVFPLIEESETLAAKAATQEFERLKEEVFPHLKDRIALMHGKLKPQEKEEVMDEFRKHNFDILVSTTVIEVGVDVPNATVMVIENADRFGLAQLHQLRGRVGRGSEQSFCYLIADSRSPSTMERLGVLTETNDGFIVAQKDLEIRGPGEFLGYRQSGLPDLLLADLVKDTKTLEDARNAALQLIKTDPDLQSHTLLRERLEQKNDAAHGEILRSG
jgi:ATP-dependent DNA helicase RecG